MGPRLRTQVTYKKVTCKLHDRGVCPISNKRLQAVASLLEMKHRTTPSWKDAGKNPPCRLCPLQPAQFGGQAEPWNSRRLNTVEPGLLTVRAVRRESSASHGYATVPSERGFHPVKKKNNKKNEVTEAG